MTLHPIESPPASARDTSDTSSKSEDDSEYTLASLSEGEISEASSGPDVSGHCKVWPSCTF